MSAIAFSKAVFASSVCFASFWSGAPGAAI